jgi:shikimate dehydrogenase
MTHAVVRLAVLGDPLRYTRSPDLHRAGAEAVGLACESEALRTPAAELPATLARLAADGYLGCNLTMPLKEPVLACLRTVGATARRARSVNTVTFRADGAHGESTDGAGFLDLLASLDRKALGARVVCLGSGGAVRSLALTLADAGAAPTRIVSRREPGDEEAWGGALGARWSAWGSAAAREAVGTADVLVNGTPLGGEALAGVLDDAAHGTLVVDLAYAETVTPWVLEARQRGLESVDGLGLLVHQARHALSIWFQREVPLAPLAAAVGWPR